MAKQCQHESNPEKYVSDPGRKNLVAAVIFNDDDIITMKLSAALCLALPVVVAGFSSPAFVGKRSTTALNVVTGPKGKPAASKEKDMELTREVIASFMGEDEDAPAPAPAEEAPKKKEKKSKKDD